jgi:hypothetical protein
MNKELVLLISMGGSIATGALMWWWLRGALREMLNQLCEKPGSTNFWARYTLLMLMIAPLMVVVFFSPINLQDTAQVLRRMILAILFGHFVTFALVGRSLFKAVREGMAQEKIIANAGSPRK